LENGLLPAGPVGPVRSVVAISPLPGNCGGSVSTGWAAAVAVKAPAVSLPPSLSTKAGKARTARPAATAKGFSTLFLRIIDYLLHECHSSGVKKECTRW